MFYSLKRSKENFVVTKTSQNPVDLTIYKQETCSDNTFVEIVPLQTITDSVEIALIQGGGLYKFVLSSLVETEVRTVEVLIPYYNNILVSLIKDFERVLCDCACKKPDDCTHKIDEQSLSDILLKVITYYAIANSFYCYFLNQTFERLRCMIIDESECVILNERILGSANKTLLLKRVVALYYLTFYFAELNLNSDKEYINEKFKFTKMAKCINLLGIDTQPIITELECLEFVQNDVNSYITVIELTYADLDISESDTQETKQTAITTYLEGYDKQPNEVLFIKLQA